MTLHRHRDASRPLVRLQSPQSTNPLPGDPDSLSHAAFIALASSASRFASLNTISNRLKILATSDTSIPYWSASALRTWDTPLSWNQFIRLKSPFRSSTSRDMPLAVSSSLRLSSPPKPDRMISPYFGVPQKPGYRRVVALAKFPSTTTVQYPTR